MHIVSTVVGELTDYRSAFDTLATASASLGFNGTSRYFPVKCLPPNGQVTLGRVFLQEAYLVAAFHRQTFTLSQRTFSTTAPSIFPPSNSSNTATSSTNIAAIVGGVLGGLLLICILLLYRQHSKHRLESTDDAPPVGGIEG